MNDTERKMGRQIKRERDRQTDRQTELNLKLIHFSICLSNDFVFSHSLLSFIEMEINQMPLSIVTSSLSVLSLCYHNIVDWVEFDNNDDDHLV